MNQSPTCGQRTSVMPRGGDSSPTDEVRELRRYVRELEEDADRTRMILETANDPFITMDAAGRVAAWNARAEHVFGWPRAEAIGQKLCDLIIPGQHRTAHENGLRHYLATGEGPLLQRPIEATALARDGREIPVELTVWPFRLNATVTFHAFVRDVTEPRRAAEAVRRSEEHFRALVEQSADMVCLFDATGTVLYVSPSVIRILGYRPTELVNRRGFDFVHPDDLAGAQTAFAGMLADPARDMLTDFRMRHRDGSWRFIEANGSNRLADPGVRGVVGHFRDVTERKAAEEALRLAEEKYRSIFENATEGIFRTTPEWYVLAANPALAAMLGYESPGQYTACVNGAGGLFRAAAEQRTGIDLALAEHDRINGLSCELVRRDGTKIQVLLHARSVSDASGRVLYIEGAVVDITDRTRLEAQLRHAQKMEAVGRLASGVAHDFNNLLTVISGYATMALEQLPEGHLRSQLTEVQRASDRAAELTRQLLAFSRKQHLQTRVIDLNALIGGVAKMLGRLIGADVELRFALAPSLDRVKVDPGQVEQVLVNLAVNARDAMPGGGRLSFATRNVERAPGAGETRSGTQAHRYVVLTVSDTGHGMDEATRTRIFEPFFTTKESGKGTGLGLAVVDSVVRQNGGHIEVHSEVGRGTTFSVYLPAVREDIESPESRAVPRPNAKGHETVLLVDDNDGVLALASHVLRSAGYTVLEARDGVEALQVCSAHRAPIHLLLTDVVMPRLSGQQLAEKLLATFPNLRVLYVSGHGEDVLRRGSPGGRTAFLQKPFTADALARDVRGLLDV